MALREEQRSDGGGKHGEHLGGADTAAEVRAAERLGPEAEEDHDDEAAGEANHDGEGVDLGDGSQRRVTLVVTLIARTTAPSNEAMMTSMVRLPSWSWSRPIPMQKSEPMSVAQRFICAKARRPGGHFPRREIPDVLLGWKLANAGIRRRLRGFGHRHRHLPR